MNVRDKSLLLIIDAQEKLFRVMFDRARLSANLQRLALGARALGVPVAVLEQTPEKLGPTIPELAGRLEGAPVFAKRTFSGGGHADFMAYLKKTGRRHILAAGIESHVCVAQTVRDLCRAGHSPRVAADATSARTADNHRIGLEICRAAGAAPTSTEAVLFEWLESADHPAFRAILQLVR